MRDVTEPRIRDDFRPRHWRYFSASGPTLACSLKTRDVVTATGVLLSFWRSGTARIPTYAAEFTSYQTILSFLCGRPWPFVSLSLPFDWTPTGLSCLFFPAGDGAGRGPDLLMPFGGCRGINSTLSRPGLLVVFSRNRACSCTQCVNYSNKGP